MTKGHLGWRTLRKAVTVLALAISVGVGGCAADFGAEPQDAAGYFTRGVHEGQAGRYERAVADYTAAIRLQPDLFGAHHNRGDAYSHLGQYDSAIADFSEAIRLQPGFAMAFNGRGNVYEKMNEHSKAVADFSSAIRLNPQYHDAYYNRGRAYRHSGNPDAAIRDYTEAIRLDPSDPDPFLARANAYGDLGEIAPALADAEQAIQLRPNWPLAYLNRGNLLFAAGQPDGAAASYDQVLRLDPGNTEAASLRCIVWLTTGSAEWDRHDCAHVAERGLTRSQYVDLIGMVHLKAGRFADARADFDTALQRKSPLRAMSLYGRAVARAKLGDAAGAKQDYAAALRIQPQMGAFFTAAGLG